MCSLGDWSWSAHSQPGPWGPLREAAHPSAFAGLERYIHGASSHTVGPLIQDGRSGHGCGNLPWESLVSAQKLGVLFVISMKQFWDDIFALIRAHMVPLCVF